MEHLYLFTDLIQGIDHNHEFVKWIFAQHDAINHYYDSDGPVPLPYTFHLDLTARVLARKEIDMVSIYHKVYMKYGIKPTAIRKAAYGHDVLEDVASRVTYHKLIKAPGIATHSDDAVQVANLIYAVSNEKGKTADERANDKYYEGIRNTPGAAIIKLADRIANVEYGLLTNNAKAGGYKKKYNRFKSAIYNEDYKPLFSYLESKLGL